MFKGKVVIVTGSSGGIGAHIAVRLAAADVSGLVITGRNETSLKQVHEKVAATNQKTKVHMVLGDIGNEEVRQKLVKDTIQHFGKLDVLINNAGIWNPKNFMDSTIDEYDKIFNINVRSVFALTKLAVPHLIQSKGNIVNISSECGKKPMGSSTFYCASKAALDHFTKCLAIELGPKGVRVNSVNPSTLPETNVFSHAGVGETEKGEFVKKLVDIYPLRRLGTVDEVCDSILHIASDHASFVTGAIFSVDGGSTLVG